MNGSHGAGEYFPLWRKNMKDTNTGRTGIGFVGILQLIFIAFKLANIIKWSWWWVLAPIWVSFALGLLLAVIVAIINAAKG